MAERSASRAVLLGSPVVTNAEDDEQMRVLSALLGCIIVAETARVQTSAAPALQARLLMATEH
jgi:hypothetical protein